MSSDPGNVKVSAGGYQLKSDLARICLPAPHAHDERNLAWVNSICLMFLIIGLAGFRAAPPPPIPVKPLEEPAMVVLEAPPPPPPTTEEIKPEDQPQEKSEALPPMVRVTLATPSIRFAVPTPGGNLVVPEKLSVAPPGESEPATAREKPAQPSRLQNTGLGGDRPAPGPDDYPKLAAQEAIQGTVVMLLTADEAGLITTVEVIRSSGSTILDRHASDWVKRRWTVSPGARGRRFQAEFVYRLGPN